MTVMCPVSIYILKLPQNIFFNLEISISASAKRELKTVRVLQATMPAAHQRH